jgi:hypothetical protein
MAGLSLFIVAIESQPSKMKYHIVGKVPKYERKIVETQKQKSILLTQIDAHLAGWFGTDASI